jgi:hypothetical protein
VTRSLKTCAVGPGWVAVTGSQCCTLSYGGVENAWSLTSSTAYIFITWLPVKRPSQVAHGYITVTDTAKKRNRCVPGCDVTFLGTPGVTNVCSLRERSAPSSASVPLCHCTSATPLCGMKLVQ